ncbi:MAG: Dabb family protein [Bacteroidetes bacterium]|nr:Dabb family protein [Bacteroidota bacterium]
MIYHTVLFKWKPDSPAAKIRLAVDALNGLQGKVPSLKMISAGENFSERSAGFSHLLVSTFLTRNDLQAYQVHPDHQKVVTEFIRPILAELVVGDVEVP